MRNLNKKVILLTGSAVLIFVLLLINCNSYYKDKYILLSANKNKIKNNNNEVYLEVLEYTAEHIALNLHNDTNSPIFVIYESKKDRPDIYFVPYRLLCQEIDKTYNDYGPDWHSLPTRKQLNQGESVKFEINPLPKINAECQISVRYFDSIKAVSLMNEFSNEYFKGYTTEEKEIIEQSKKDATISITINSNK